MTAFPPSAQRLTNTSATMICGAWALALLVVLGASVSGYASAEEGGLPRTAGATTSREPAGQVAPRVFKAVPPWRAWESWVGPMPFASQQVREDFSKLWEEPDRWSRVRTQTEVFKSYIGILRESAGLDLGGLLGLLDANHMKVAFEVGGLRYPRTRPASEWCNRQLGEATAANELRALRRWKRANDGRGHIEYITTDHAIAGVWKTRADPDVPLENRCFLTIRELAEELADYYKAIQTEFPEARFGLIESLGYWRIGDWRPTQPWLRLPFTEVRLSEVLREVTTAASARGITLDHYHIDFGMEGVEHDGAGAGLGFGRVVAAQEVARSAGLRVGVIANAFGYVDDVKCDESAALDPFLCNESAAERTMAFLSGYFKTDEQPDAILLQQWQPNPDTLGDESWMRPTSSLGLAFAALFDHCMPASLEAGDYQSFDRIFRVQDSVRYCQWLRSGDYPGDPGQLPGVGALPRGMTYVGDCAGPQ